MRRSDVSHLSQPERAARDYSGNYGVGAAPTRLIPNIRDHLDQLLSLCNQLNMIADGLGNSIYGDGSPKEMAVDIPPPPFSIPDKLSTIENVLRRVQERLESISTRL